MSMDLIDLVRQTAPFIEAWVEHQRRFSHTPGVQEAIRVGDELGASFALGTSNVVTGEPLTTTHLFHVASHSKTFTSTAVMQLVEAGRLRLDDPLHTWVSELDGSPAAAYTIRELLGHQSGINRDGADSDHWQLIGDFPDRRRLVQFARADAVLHSNEFFKYSNIGYSLLGLVIEAASGEPYDDYVMAHIVQPVGLVNTGPELPPERRAELAGAHGIVLDPTDERPVIDDVPTNAESPATGFFSTAEEITRYMACHALGREELVSDASKRLMHRRESRITRGGERFYGLGFIMAEVDGRLLVGHSGGWPGHITNTWLDPQTGLCVSVLTNRMGGPAGELSRAIIELIDMVVAAETDGPSPAPEGVDPESFVGTYAQMWGFEDIVLLGSRLYSMNKGMLSPQTFATPLQIIDGNTLCDVPEDSFGATGEAYHFERNERGFVTSLRHGGATAWPFATWARMNADPTDDESTDDEAGASLTNAEAPLGNQSSTVSKPSSKKARKAAPAGKVPAKKARTTGKPNT